MFVDRPNTTHIKLRGHSEFFQSAAQTSKVISNLCVSPRTASQYPPPKFSANGQCGDPHDQDRKTIPNEIPSIKTITCKGTNGGVQDASNQYIMRVFGGYRFGKEGAVHLPMRMPVKER